ncbi:MAG: hypothetical protein Q8Q73_10535 [Stagnimonas sp.]|nr:hypothetical protein [Stagnimonas sp.]
MLNRDPVADARMARSRGVADYALPLLLYPLGAHCLPVIAMLAFFITLSLRTAGTLPLGIPDAGLPLLAISLIWTLFYLLEVIRETARGHARAPPLRGEALYLAVGLKPLTLPLLVGAGWLALRTPHPQAALALLAVAAFVLPAYLFILATEDVLLYALDPARWLRLMGTLGASYLLPGLALAGSVWLLRLAAGWLSGLLLAGLTGYLLFGVAHLLGYLGFRRHAELGLALAVKHPDQQAREQEQVRRQQQLLIAIDAALLAGDEAAATRLIETAPGGPLSLRDALESLFWSLRSKGLVRLVPVAGRRLIGQLLSEQRSQRALEVAETCLNLDPRFQPARIEQLEALARQAIVGRYPELLQRLLRHAGDGGRDPQWAGLQFLHAQYLAEQRGDDAAALALVEPLLGHRDHPQAAAFAAYARALKSLTQRGL